MKEEKLACKIKRTASGYQYDCGEERRGFCVASNKSRSGGLNIIGSGISGGYSQPDIFCVDVKDLKKKLSEKYRKEVIIHPID